MKRLLLVGLIALALPAPAWAHATLESTTPRFGKELQASPATITLHFDQVVKVLPGAVQVLNSKGVNFAGPARISGTNVIATVRHTPRGAYTVRWRAISADSHVTAGVWTYGVGVPAPSVQDAYGAGGPGATEDVVRWIWFLGLAFTIGATGLRLICLRGIDVPLALARRITVAAGIGAVVALQAGIAAFSLRSEDALQLPFGKFFYGDLSPIAVTAFGQAFIAMTLGFAAVLALLFFAWLLDRAVFLVPAFVLSVVFVFGLSVSGHDGQDPGSYWATKLADYVHLVAASLWVGGLATLALVVWRQAPELRGIAFRRFSQVATVSIVLVVAAGTYLAIVRLPHLHDLWSTGYGQVLIVKSSLVLVALAWGGIHKFLIAPKLDRPDAGGFLTKIGRSLIGESLLAAGVLLVAAVLVDSRPPPPTVKTAPVAAARP